MTWIDWIIIVVLAVSLLGGFIQGFLRSVFSLCGLLLGLLLAAWNYERLARPIRPAVHSEMIADAVAFLIIAVLVMAVAAITGKILSKIMHKIGLGCLDRILGAFFGLFQGALLVTVFILVALAFFPKAQWLAQSRLPRYFFGACHLSTRVTPDKLAERVRSTLKSLEKASPRWMHPDSGRV